MKFVLIENQKDRYWNDTKKQLIKLYPNYEKVMAQCNIELKRLGVNVATNINKVPVVHSGGSFRKYLGNFPVRHLDGLFYQTDLSVSDKKEIDDKLKE